MGYGSNIVTGLLMGLIIYVLTEKTVIIITEENNFNDKIQKGFIISFIIGLTYIALGMTAFSENNYLENHSLQIAFMGAGIFLVLNSVFINWNNLDEETKMIILAITISGLVIYSYNNSDINRKRRLKIL